MYKQKAYFLHHHRVCFMPLFLFTVKGFKPEGYYSIGIPSDSE
ncbi:hypothetical protein EZS27_029921 [termite gut metagenome]|uniref:Uncharacterized protein n=1 Tax=termite gut metagenome TaxID=433724 RepID=A0A5J4QEW8_9ZZZZ